MIKIRPAGESDAASIRTLLRETWLDTYGYLSQCTLDEVFEIWHSVDGLTKGIRNDKIYFPVTLEGESIGGIAAARDLGGITDLLRLSVSPWHQRRGIGRMLLNAAEEHFPADHIVQVHVERQAEKARPFYEKHGFKEVCREPLTIVNEIVDGFLMEKTL